MEHNFLNIKEREIHPQPKYEIIMINKSEITHKNTQRSLFLPIKYAWKYFRFSLQSDKQPKKKIESHFN